MHGGYYKHSGKFSAAGLVAMPLLGIGIGSALAFVYAYAILYIPFISILTFVLSAGFGALAGVATGIGAKLGKVRSNAIALVGGLLIMLVVFYVSWVAWVYGLVHRGDAPLDIPLLGLFLSPGGLWGLILEINAVGAWSLKGATPTGLILWLLWAVEAVLIIGPGVFLTIGMIDGPFCEKCNKWCDEKDGVAHLGLKNADTLVESLESGNLAALDEAGPADPEEGSWLQVNLRECPTPSCKETNTLRIGLVSLKVGDGGKVEQETSPLVQDLLVTQDQLPLIEGLGSKYGTLTAAPIAE